jgi:hypothetical protein
LGPRCARDPAQGRSKHNPHHAVANNVAAEKGTHKEVDGQRSHRQSCVGSRRSPSFTHHKQNEAKEQDDTEGTAFNKEFEHNVVHVQVVTLAGIEQGRGHVPVEVAPPDACGVINSNLKRLDVKDLAAGVARSDQS